MKPVNIAVLASGGGTNLQALIDNARMLGETSPYRVVCVICDRTNTGAEARALREGIPVERVLLSVLFSKDEPASLPRAQKLLARSDAVLALCRRFDADAIVLAGFLSILSGRVIEEYDGRIVNLHPSLLPEFGGEGMWGHRVHEAVIGAGKRESGCTVHYVNSVVDGGGIIVQKKIPVRENDTPDTLAARLAPLEHEAIVEAVTILCEKIRGAKRG
jgi:phosphoribosylglycinamide formyltransferase-1